MSQDKNNNDAGQDETGQNSLAEEEVSQVNPAPIADDGGPPPENGGWRSFQFGDLSNIPASTFVLVAIGAALFFVFVLVTLTPILLSQRFPAATIFTSISSLVAAILIVAFAANANSPTIRTLALLVVASMIVPLPDLAVVWTTFRGDEARGETAYVASSRRASSHNREAGQSLAIALTDAEVVWLNDNADVQLTELADAMSCMLNRVELSKISQEVDARGASLLLRSLYENRMQQLLFGSEIDAEMIQDFRYLRERYLIDFPYSNYTAARLTVDGCLLVRGIFQDVYDASLDCPQWLRAIEEAGNEPVEDSMLYGDDGSVTTSARSAGGPRNLPGASAMAREPEDDRDDDAEDGDGNDSRMAQRDYALEACLPQHWDIRGPVRTMGSNPVRDLDPPFDQAFSDEDIIELGVTEGALSGTFVTRTITLTPEQHVGRWLHLTVTTPGRRDLQAAEQDWVLSIVLSANGRRDVDPYLYLVNPFTRSIVGHDDDGGSVFSSTSASGDTSLDSRIVRHLNYTHSTYLIGARDLREGVGPMELTISLQPVVQVQPAGQGESPFNSSTSEALE